MPGMSGYQLAEKVRGGWPDLRIVVMSGTDLAGKGYSVVRKPFSQPQLERIFARAGVNLPQTDERCVRFPTIESS